MRRKMDRFCSTRCNFLRIRALALALLLLLTMCLPSGCGRPQDEAAGQEQPQQSPDPEAALPDTGLATEAYGLTAGILYDASSGSTAWQDTCGLLEQSVLIGLTVEAADLAALDSLDRFDLVIPDASLAASSSVEKLADLLAEYTREGGFVLLDNAFSQVLPLDYLGLSATEKIEGCPLDLSFPALGADLGAVQEVIRDFAALLPEYHEAEEILARDYGYSFTAATATPLATLGDQAIYTYHTYGGGGVLLTNPLLPNVYSLGNFSMAHRSGEETAFANTTASCNQLLLSRFAGYVAKQHYGYALNRVFGYNGSPSMSWELHYEEITGYEHNSMMLFDKICREYQQIPSYTIIRSSYWWFLRTESVTYLLNQSDSGYDYRMDYDESAYSSGTHIVSGDQWLHINSIEKGGSYFVDYPEHNYRAYPCFGDVDGDGQDELVSGSADGYFYVYDDLTFTGRLEVSAPRRLTDADGLALRCSSFSSPQIADLDGDGTLDLLTGSDHGALYWYKGLGGGAFEDQGLFLNADILGQSLPAVGDINGDGKLDLAVGSNQAILLLFYGQSESGLTVSHEDMESYSKFCANAGLGKWLAPSIVGSDLVIGTFPGYIAILSGDEPWEFIYLNEKNFRGNYHAKFGNYCVPVFYDVNGDGSLDLVCGSLEYGLAYPIDSPYFPFRDQLQAQIDYAKENFQYIGVHHYSNGFASPEREAYELRRHKEAFASYGLDFEGLGANMHTWYMSIQGDSQTLDSEYNAGLLWNSGFSAPGDPGVVPQCSAENVIALPFFLQKDGEDTILVQNCSVLPYMDGPWTALSAKYKMPVCIYYHCDFVYANDADARSSAQKAAAFQYANGYNFMREDQLMAASAAAYNLGVLVEQEDGVLRLTPTELSQAGSLYDPLAQSAAGLEIQFAEHIDAGQYKTDAKVFHREGNSIFLRLGETVTLSDGALESPLRQVNLPADITVLENGADITFLDNGMLQVVTPLGYTANTSSTGWTVTQQGEHLVFTKYGEADTLHIRKAP